MTEAQEIEVSEREVRLARIEMKALESAGLRVDPMVRKLATAPIVLDDEQPMLPAMEGLSSLLMQAQTFTMAHGLRALSLDLMPAFDGIVADGDTTAQLKNLITAISPSLDQDLSNKLSKISTYLTSHEMDSSEQLYVLTLLQNATATRSELGQWLSEKDAGVGSESS